MDACDKTIGQNRFMILSTQLQRIDLLRQFYVIDSTTTVDPQLRGSVELYLLKGNDEQLKKVFGSEQGLLDWFKQNDSEFRLNLSSCSMKSITYEARLGMESESWLKCLNCETIFSKVHSTGCDNCWGENE